MKKSIVSKEHAALIKSYKSAMNNARIQAAREKKGPVKITSKYWRDEAEKLKGQIQDIVLNGSPTKQQILMKLPTAVSIRGVVGNKNHVYVDGVRLRLRDSLKFRRHSITTYGWGYNGSGPAQLALSILLKYLDKDTSLKYYLTLKTRLVSTFPQGDFEEIINLRLEVQKIIEEKDGK